MMKHFIVLSSSYSEGTRIAIDFLIEGGDTKNEINLFVKRVFDECGDDVSLSTHLLETPSTSWKSVTLADSFFDDVKLIESEDEFISLIQKDRKLNSLSVAKYILSKIKCAHLQLEKLLYLCFADYLCTTGKLLFDDKIYAFRYGPIVKSVYDTYKEYGGKTISIDDKYEMPFRSMISFAKFGREKLISIDKTLRKYGEFSASELVDITHRKGSPWEREYDGTHFKEISIENIEKYHSVEAIQ